MELECIEIDQPGIDTASGMSAAAAVQGSVTPAWPSAADDSDDDGFSVISEPNSPAVPEGPVPVALYQAGATI